MAMLSRMLALGNGKLGEQIMHFDLPAVTTCPGRSPVCERVCYARSGRFHFTNVVERLEWCHRQSLRNDFERRLSREIRTRGVLVLRLHVSGDFYDACYAEKWLRVMQGQPHVRYYFYTRSWRVPEIEAVLRRMALLSCCRVWYSCDRDTGTPEEVPQGVRLAYMQDTAAVEQSASVVFRTNATFGSPRIALPLVCPSDTPQGRSGGANCGSCGHCWRE